MRYVTLFLTLILMSCTFTQEVGRRYAEFKDHWCNELTAEERTAIRSSLRTVKCLKLGTAHPALVKFCAFRPETQVAVMGVIDAGMCPEEYTGETR